MQSKIRTLVTGKSGEVYNKVLENEVFNRNTSPHGFIKNMYEKYKELYPSEPSINGRIFEYLVCETLAYKSIAPFYYQAVFEWVPNANFDLVLYHPRFPVVLTMKTSLRERYKKADLEGLALRQVYRGAKSYLITLNPKEAKIVQRKIENGEVSALEGCLTATEKEYTLLLDELSKKEFQKSREIMPLKGTLFSV